jgi:hypothetical protein
VAVATLTTLSVQGCGTGTAAQATSGAAHDLTIAEARSVYQTYLTTSDNAAALGDETAGQVNLSDAQWEIVHGQYTALAQAGTPVPRYQYGTPDFYVPALSGYPKWFMVAVARHPLGATGAVTTLMTFELAKAGNVWTLAGSTALDTGQSLPAVTRDGEGYATALSTRDSNLLLPPNAVGATQAAVVDDGPASPAAAVVSSGPQTTELYAQQSAYASTHSGRDLQYIFLMQGASFPVFALRTADGGALVVYGIFLNTTTEHPNAALGAPIPVPADVAPMQAPPTGVGLHAVYVNWTYEFAAIDPPSSAHGQKLTVIAATGGPTYVHAN